jgi:hypothetical protein
MDRDRTLVTGFDPDTGLYDFAVKAGGRVIHFRPGFRARDEVE